MARKLATMTIQTPGRDQGKVFQLTEMSAMQAEEWAYKAARALYESQSDYANFLLGLYTGEDGGSSEEKSKQLDALRKIGMDRLYTLGYSQICLMESGKKLLDELMGCVRYIPDPKNPDFIQRILETDIEEAATYKTLKQEVFKLHTGFFMIDGLSTQISP